MRTVKKMLVVAALAAFLLALPQGFAEPRDGWSLENRVPSTSLGFVSIEDIGGMQARFEQTAIARLMAEPEMKAFAEPIGKALTSMLEEDPQGRGGPFGDATPMVMKILKQLQGLRGQVAVAILDVDLDGGVPQVAASLDFGPNVADFITFLKGLRAEIDPDGKNLSEYERDGRTWWQVQDGPPITATTVDTAFVLATSPTLLQGVISSTGEAALGGHADFKAVRAKAGGDQLGMFAYANVPAIIQLVGGKMGEEAAAIAQHLGLDTIKGAAYGMSFAGDGFMDSIIVHAPGADHGLVPLMHMPPYQPQALAFAPANAFVFDELSANFDELLGNIRKLITRIDPEMVQGFEEGLGQVNQMLGVDLEKDIVGGMAGPMAWYAAIPDTGGLYPELAVMMQVKDPGAFEDTFDQMARGLAGMANEEGDMVASTRTLEYHGKRLHLFEMQAAHGRKVIPFTPTWAMLDNWLVVTLVPHAMKEIVLRQEAGQTGGLAAQEDFQSLQRMRPESAGRVGYLDLQAILSLVYDTGVPLLQTAVKPNLLGKDVPFPLDWAQLPAARTVRPYFRSMGVFMTWNTDGLSLQMHGPLPLMGVMMVGAAAAMPMMMLGRTSGRRSMPAIPLEPGGASPSLPRGDAQARMAQLQAEQLGSYVRVFVLTQKRLPEDLEELVSKDVAASVPTDPWGSGYMLEVIDAAEKRFRIRSAGPDGDFGTEDDVVTGK